MNPKIKEAIIARLDCPNDGGAFGIVYIGNGTSQGLWWFRTAIYFDPLVNKQPYYLMEKNRYWKIEAF